MALVGYSDSEGSEDEQPRAQSKNEKPTTKPSTTSNSNFAINRANPRKIQVKLQDIPTESNNVDGERASKRPRLGAGGAAFNGFNAMLPPPKRDADAKATSKTSTRKVFSLKTGAEPGFSRDSDTELRQLFAEQGQPNGSAIDDLDTSIPAVPKSMNQTSSDTREKAVQGNPFMFKPLSVARGKNKAKRKPVATGAPISDMPAKTNGTEPTISQTSDPAPPPKKVSLFSMNHELDPQTEPQIQDEEDEIVEVLEEPWDQDVTTTSTEDANNYETSQPQSLDTIATDLNLSKADRRQLFGRRGQNAGTAVNVVNFNTDQEYAANEVLRANGEQIQHNPVRAIAPGKHSLKQLVSAATGQKDALEESFATGRRNKKEAGNKYGW